MFTAPKNLPGLQDLADLIYLVPTRQRGNAVSNLPRSHAPAWECREHRASGAGRCTRQCRHKILPRSHAPAWECREHRASGAGRCTRIVWIFLPRSFPFPCWRVGTR
jgi:hypothetical protein